MIVLDANILVRAALGRRVRQIIETYSQQGIRFLTPDAAVHDAERYLPSLLEKRGISTTKALKSAEFVREFVEVIDVETYSVLETQARQRLQGRDEDDWPVLACALALGCPIWTEDHDFFGTGVPVWTTSRVQIFLDGAVERKTPS